MAEKKYKFFGLILFLLLLCTGLGALGIVFFRERRKGLDFAEAVAALESGRTAEAKKMLGAILRHDENHEPACVLLASIADGEDSWQEAAAYWRHAASLNALKPEYRRHWKNALAMGRDFRTLRDSFLLSLDLHEIQSDEDSFFILLPDSTARENADVRRYRQLLQKKKPTFFTTDYGRFIRCLKADPRSEKTLREWKTLAGSPIPVVGFEASLQLAATQALQEVPPREIEQTLRAAVARNAFAGLPHLENFFIEHRQLDRAAVCCEENYRRFRRPSSAIKLAEMHLLSGEADRIPRLLPDFSGCSKPEMITAGYLESLIAFAADDAATVNAKFRQIKGLVGTPVSMLVDLYDATSSGDAAAVGESWMNFRMIPAFYDLPARGQKLMLVRIGRMIGRGENDAALQLLDLPGVDFSADRRIAEFYIVGKLRRNQLTDAKMDRALKDHPDSPAILAAGAEFFYRSRKFKTSLELIRQVRQHSAAPENFSLRTLEALNYAGMGRVDEASAILRELLTRRPGDSRLLLAACQFAEEHRRPPDREDICRILAAAHSPLLPYAQGEMLLRQGRRSEALDQLEKLDAGSPELLFRAAKTLGENDRIAPAMKLYRKILRDKKTPEEIVPFALVNLAELYAASDRLPEACDTAGKAWRICPKHPVIQSCYAGMLRKKGQTDRILEIITPPPYRDPPGSARRELWIAAAEAELARNPANDEDTEQLYSVLRAVAPDSAAVREFRQKKRQTEDATP